MSLLSMDIIINRKHVFQNRTLVYFLTLFLCSPKAYIEFCTFVLLFFLCLNNIYTDTEYVTTDYKFNTNSIEGVFGGTLSSHVVFFI